MTSEVQSTKRVTAADVARSVGLSRATVGFVLNRTPGQTIPESTRQRVLAEAERLGYRPHRGAKALASGRSQIVLLVLPDWPMDHSMRANLDEVSAALDREGYSLVTATMHADGRAQPLWETLNPDLVMGMLPFTAEELARIRASGVQRVVPAEPVSPEAAMHGLGIDDGPRLQVEHLVERGRRRLAFAGSTDPRVSALVGSRRLRAKTTCRSLLGRDLIAEADVSPGNISQVVGDWVDQGIDGVVAYNDDVAALVTGALLRSGHDVPAELAVIGHDDTPLAALFYPSLSSVRFDRAGLGRYLAAVALAAISGAKVPVGSPDMNATVIHRESS